MPIRSIAEWFGKKKKESKYKEYKAEKLDIPGELWVKCYKCGETLYQKDLEKNLKVCPKCGYHFKLAFRERLAITLDNGSFVEYDALIRSQDFLHFTDTMPYSARLEEAAKKSGLSEAILTGEGKIDGHPVAIGVMDFGFMGGSMGSVVGEKVTRLIEQAIEKELQLIIIPASGGARMQEGIMSLMQMAKTAAALAQFSETKLPYIVIMTDPTTAGVSASYGMLGDFHLAEPGALIGFAGPRVIELTIRQKLQPGFQRAEYLKEHGIVDKVVERKKIKETIVKILEFAGK